MYSITLQTENINDILLFQLLADKIGVKLISKNNLSYELKKIDEYFKIIDSGGDMSNVKNPVEWQRNQRKDRNIFDSKISLKRGSAKNIITFIADDFTSPLEDFKDYM